MKRIHLVFAYFFVFSSFSASAQNEFPIKIHDFSDIYEASIELSDEDKIIKTEYDEYLAAYVIRIRNKKDGKEVLRGYTSDLPFHLINENNETYANIKELPYGDQSVLFYEDYNFDGKKDLALMSGYHSCYGGPAFDIYLATNLGFEYNSNFSVLSNEYCGMFEVDGKSQTLYTMVKSGCCWHRFSEYKVIDNEPKIFKSVTHDRTSMTIPLLIKETQSLWVNNKPIETERFLLFYEDDMDIVVSFELEKSKKRVVVFTINHVLYYALEQQDSYLEFYFPKPYYDEIRKETIYKSFTFDTVDKTLSFHNVDAVYTLYQTENTVGIRVKTEGKTYDLKGIYSSLSGSLNIFDVQSLDEIKWKNIKYE